jgi:hypothetical protein
MYVDAKARRSGKPSSMALKPALEIASNFLGRVCSSLQPIETLAKQTGMFLVFSSVSDILRLLFVKL